MRDKQVANYLQGWSGFSRGIISSHKPMMHESLSAILETDVAPKFFLSAKAAQGILNRAERRGKALPPMLQEELRATANSLTGNTPMMTKHLQLRRVITKVQPILWRTTPLKAGNPGEKTVVTGTLAASGAGTMRPAGQRNELDMVIPIAMSPIAFNHHVGTGTLAAGAVSPTLLGGNNTQPAIAFSNQPSPKWGIDITPPLMAHERGGGQQDGVTTEGYNAVRRLTPTECERLQGFPDGWTAVNGQSDSARYKQMGNAVAVPCIAWLGKQLILADIARKQ